MSAMSLCLPSSSVRPIRLGAALLASCLIAVSAQCALPAWPAPVTLQTLVVLALALRFGGRLAVSAMLFYIVEALFGLPVMSGMKGGAVALFGPTGGYVFGMLCIAVLAGVYRGVCLRSKCSIFLVSLSLLLLNLLIGAIYLACFVGPQLAFYAGFVVFLLAEVAKALLLAAFLSARD